MTLLFEDLLISHYKGCDEPSSISWFMSPWWVLLPTAPQPFAGNLFPSPVVFPDKEDAMFYITKKARPAGWEVCDGNVEQQLQDVLPAWPTLQSILSVILGERLIWSQG